MKKHNFCSTQNQTPDSKSTNHVWLPFQKAKGYGQGLILFYFVEVFFFQKKIKTNLHKRGNKHYFWTCNMWLLRGISPKWNTLPITTGPKACVQSLHKAPAQPSASSSYWLFKESSTKQASYHLLLLESHSPFLLNPPASLPGYTVSQQSQQW